MTAVEQDVPIREARDNLAAIVDAAGAGTVTFITRRGEKVAAVVPVYRARPLPGPATPQIEHMPAARGGRFERDLTAAQTTGSLVNNAERQWTRAALEAMHLRLGAAMAELVAWQRVTGQCLAAAVEGEHSSFPLSLALSGEQAATAELQAAANLLYALTTPDDAYCATCQEPLDTFHGHPGYQHWREVPGDRGVHLEVYTPSDGHTADVRKRPRERPAITNGAVVPSWRAER
jgi:prevent-host-death family protein